MPWTAWPRRFCFVSFVVTIDRRGHTHTCAYMYIFKSQARTHYMNSRRDLVRWVLHENLPAQSDDRDILKTIDQAVLRGKATKLEVFIVIYACDPKSGLKHETRKRMLDKDICCR